MLLLQVGAPPEIARLLEEIRRENDPCKSDAVSSSTCFGADPELDEFMVPPFFLSAHARTQIYIHIYIYIYIYIYNLYILLLQLSSRLCFRLSIFFSGFRKPTATCWWSINPTWLALLMKQPLSSTRSKCSSAISALVLPFPTFLVCSSLSLFLFSVLLAVSSCSLLVLLIIISELDVPSLISVLLFTKRKKKR